MAAPVNRHKGRLVSRELNGLWSQSAAIARSIRVCKRGHPSCSVPSRPVRFPFRAVSAHPKYSSMARYVRPAARKSPRATCPTKCTNFGGSVANSRARKLHPALALALARQQEVRLCSLSLELSLELSRVALLVIRDLNYWRVMSLQAMIRRLVRRDYLRSSRLRACSIFFSITRSRLSALFGI